MSLLDTLWKKTVLDALEKPNLSNYNILYCSRCGKRWAVMKWVLRYDSTFGHPGLEPVLGCPSWWHRFWYGEVRSR